MGRNYKPNKKKLADLDISSELEAYGLALLSKRAEAISVADYRSERGEIVAKLLDKVADDFGSDECAAYSERLKRCADRSNFYFGEDFLDNSTGELFAGFGNLFGCGLKLCQSCVARQAARNRNIARNVVKNTKLLKREHFCYVKKKKIIEQEKYRFVTLTMPEVDSSLQGTFAIQKRAWDLFRKLNFTKDYFPGYIKGVESTFRESGTYHAHIHLLAISFFVPEKLIKLNWTNCVKTAFSEFGIEFEATQANVNLSLVDSIENAIKEICKYLTKSTTWEQIPAEHLLEVALVRRWDRMFDMAGRLRKTKQKLEAAVRENSSKIETKNADDDYVHTDGIIDGELLEVPEKTEILRELLTEKTKRVSWRDLVREVGIENYKEILDKQVNYTQNIRKLRLLIKYPDANFTDLDGNAWNLAELQKLAEKMALSGIDLGI